jgi:hypothetical protein
VRVVAPDELVDVARLQQQERIQAFAFSACTLDIHSTRAVVFNLWVPETRS